MMTPVPSTLSRRKAALMVVALLAAPSTVPACNPPGDPVVAKVALYDGSHY
jgi:hypothetical protein